MCSRGGGVLDMAVRKLKKTKNLTSIPDSTSFHLIVHFKIDTCDAMGANLAATIAEGFYLFFFLNTIF